MNVKVLKSEWYRGLREDTYEIQILVGAVRSGRVLRCVGRFSKEVDRTSSAERYIELKTQADAGSMLVAALLENHKAENAAAKKPIKAVPLPTGTEQ